MRLEKQLENIRQEENEILKKIDERNGKREIDCMSCESAHQIKDLTLIQQHWYETPSSCDDGDTWHQGELRYVCPETNDVNRILFYVPYEDAKEFKTNPAKQFESKYKSLFNEVIDFYERSCFSRLASSYSKNGKDLEEEKIPNEGLVNNVYVENNLKKFELTRGKK